MSQDQDHRAKLARLADALMQDIIAAPDEDILAEVDRGAIERARALLIEVRADMLRQQLAKAKTEFSTWSSATSHESSKSDGAYVREQFDKLRRGDSQFNRKITLAARNGTPPTDNDMQGLVEDWADLQRLDDEDGPE
jgi:hypothetical protein